MGTPGLVGLWIHFRTVQKQCVGFQKGQRKSEDSLGEGISEEVIVTSILLYVNLTLQNTRTERGERRIYFHIYENFTYLLNMYLRFNSHWPRLRRKKAMHRTKSHTNTPIYTAGTTKEIQLDIDTKVPIPFIYVKS